MQDALRTFQADCIAAFAAITSSDELEATRVAFLGRKGRLVSMLASLPSLEEEARRKIGALANEVKKTAEGAYAAAKARVEQAEASARSRDEWIDITLPGASPALGHLHLTTQAIDEIAGIFAHLGFVRARHPEVDWDEYAFASLNMPKEHPARDEWETFFVADGGEMMTGAKGKVVLTPHTSNGQVREMEKGKLPIRMISIGKCYRRESTARHLSMFHQFEGLMIDKKATVTELKGVVDYFVKRFFGPDRVTRLRPHHFAFTEPSFELDISCSVCDGTGRVGAGACRLCKEGWLELGGAGMVHPNVLTAGGLNPDDHTGFAFGWGIERTMMMRSGLNIDDIRMLYRNDLRFLRQF